MFNDNKKNFQRLKSVDSEIEKLNAELASERRQYQNDTATMNHAVRIRDYVLEAEKKEALISRQKKIDQLCKQLEPLSSQRDDLQSKIDRDIRDSLRNSPTFKKYDEYKRSVDALEAKERELEAQFRRAHMEASKFIEAGAGGPNRWEAYQKRCAELSTIASKLNDQFVATRAEKETIMESQLQPASSLLHQLESQKFEELMKQ